MAYMNAALPDNKFKRVEGKRIGNLFVHRRIYSSLTRSCKWVYKLTNEFQISQFGSGYSLGDYFRFSKEQKAIAMARKLDFEIPEFKHPVSWFTKHGKPIGEKARAIVTLKAKR